MVTNVYCLCSVVVQSLGEHACLKALLQCQQSVRGEQTQTLGLPLASFSKLGSKCMGILLTVIFFF